MLEKDPEKRITSKDILSHPYLNHSCNSSFNDFEENNQISLGENIQKYNQESNILILYFLKKLI